MRHILHFHICARRKFENFGRNGILALIQILCYIKFSRRKTIFAVSDKFSVYVQIKTRADSVKPDKDILPAPIFRNRKSTAINANLPIAFWNKRMHRCLGVLSGFFRAGKLFAKLSVFVVKELHIRIVVEYDIVSFRLPRIRDINIVPR